jgi:hypothetical protein
MERSVLRQVLNFIARQSYSFITAHAVTESTGEIQMKLLKVVLVACSLSAAVAHAQTAVPADSNAQQVAQTLATQSAGQVTPRPVAAPAKKAEECVGPVSYCNIFFGS